MTDAQYYTLIAVPLIGILMNGGLYIFLAGRVDKVADNVGQLAERMAKLETRVAGLERHS